ncbi:MAG: AAA family ATPase [Lachnospiraceae bacterium]|jgi:predicted ATP-binding protein involved in virulence
MKINNLKVDNFRLFDDMKLQLNGKNTVIFGVNGTGKTSILKSINLLYANIINQIVNRKELKQNLNIELDDIKYGKTQTKLEADFFIENQLISYNRTMIRKSGKRSQDLESLKILASIFQDKYVSDEKQENIPIFVNYGTNRLVLDIPIRIRTKHQFDIYAAFDKAIENRIDFRTFFEWFRNQEDYENECKVQNADLQFTDKALDSVKKAMLVMLDGCTNLRVARKPRLEMKVDKNGVGLNVSQLSDGEKCTMALFGDLARRLTIANPNLDNPLLGEGVVLIDEIELHMHPFWQRNVVGKLRETFPNIQFIITTHSPIVLSEIDDEFNIYFLQNKEASSEVIEFKRLDGFDANYILEEFMGTKSMNSKTETLISDIYRLINGRLFEEAEEKVNHLKELTDATNKDVIRAGMLIKRGRLS